MIFQETVRTVAQAKLESGVSLEECKKAKSFEVY